MTLHLIQRSPFSNSALKDCLTIIDSKDSILLMEDGVYGLQHTLMQQAQSTAYALQEDITARGLTSKSGIKEIDYCEFVTLCSQHKHVISWY